MKPWLFALIACWIVLLGGAYRRFRGLSCGAG